MRLRRIRFGDDNRGVAMVEFALATPLLLLVCFGGLEYVNYVLALQKIERIASLTADAIARNTLPPSERSFIDTLRAVDKVGAPFKVDDQGRTIITGVIGVTQGDRIVNKVVWQRCGGRLRGVGSTVGAEWRTTADYADGPNITLPNEISLLQNQMVVIAEVAYRYRPMISLGLLATQPDGIIRQRSVFVTRGQAIPYITPSPGGVSASCD
jgi:hypothetical protein